MNQEKVERLVCVDCHVADESNSFCYRIISSIWQYSTVSMVREQKIIQLSTIRLNTVFQKYFPSCSSTVDFSLFHSSRNRLGFWLSGRAIICEGHLIGYLSIVFDWKLLWISPIVHYLAKIVTLTTTISQGNCCVRSPFGSGGSTWPVSWIQ